MNALLCMLFGHRWKLTGVKKGYPTLDWSGEMCYEINYESTCSRCEASKLEIPAQESDYGSDRHEVISPRRKPSQRQS